MNLKIWTPGTSDPHSDTVYLRLHRSRISANRIDLVVSYLTHPTPRVSHSPIGTTLFRIRGDTGALRPAPVIGAQWRHNREDRLLVRDWEGTDIYP